MEVIVEQLGTTNNVLERQKFDQHQVWLGRAFSNDVILTDEHVDGTHALLEFDDEGRLWISDRGSVNGIRRPRHKTHIEREEVRSGDVYLIGRSRIRIYVGTHPVVPAVKIRFSEVFLLWLGKPEVTVALAMLFVAAKTLEIWLGTIGEFRWSLVIEQNFTDVMLFVGLAVGVYFLSVLFRRGGNFLAHLSLLVLVFLVSSLLEFATGVAVFNAGDRWYPALDIVDSARGYLMLFVYLWSILYLAFHISLLRRTLVSLGVVAVLIGISNLPEDEMTRFVQQQSFPLEQQFLPPVLLLREPVPAEAFERRAANLFDALDEKRLEALDKRDEQETEAIDEQKPAPAGGEPQVRSPDRDGPGPDPQSARGRASYGASARARQASSSLPSTASSGLREIAPAR
ncbi:MAG: FHA domain-containing protein [Wenzhouxiangellaceae bacterium]|nr:FHA domain-containing protein [Wenzhouxiangellaceae bacterium]